MPADVQRQPARFGLALDDHVTGLTPGLRVVKADPAAAGEARA